VRRSTSSYLRSASLVLGLLCVKPLLAQEQAAPQSEADQKAACATGFEQSQILRQAGKLRASHGELLKCVQSICSRPAQEQCGRWLEDVERLTPSIVVQATADGQDRSDVQVEMDGEVLTGSIAGTALEADPGPHAFTFTCADYPPVKKNFVLREGEKLRSIGVAFVKPKSAKTDAAAVPAVKPVELHRPVPALAYALGGVAVLGAGAFTYLGLTGESRRTDLKNNCAPNCTDSQLNPVHQRLVAADISLGVGVAALAGAAIVYLTRPTVPVKEKAASFAGNVFVTANAISASGSFAF
jgi:hypothetical protein